MSDPARPESAGQAALAELTSVIRNVTEQLSGFRRRALAAESRLRELEQAAAAAEQATRAQAARAAALESTVAETKHQAARIEALEHELAHARADRTRVEELEQELAGARSHRARVEELERELEAAQRASEAALNAPAQPAAAGGVAYDLLEAENAALRERLGEAVERTRVIGARVRFLRQQLGNGVEK